MTMTPQGRQTLFEWLVRALVLCACLPVHEFAHAYVADKLGDDTARRQGRLTLNPIRHLDLWGSLLLIFVGFGYAKPVPVDARRFRHPKRDMALTAAAGPLSNILMSILLLAVFKMFFYTGLSNIRTVAIFLSILEIIIIVNLGLAVFNLLPIPPLDGSKLLGAILPDRIYYRMARYDRMIVIALFVLLWTGVLSTPLSFLRGQLLVLLDVVTRPIDILFAGR
ncbi:MAG: site-2 protease family protein [Oscillospiraceae bacterium]|jgi:Zn-dependent protease